MFKSHGACSVGYVTDADGASPEHAFPPTRFLIPFPRGYESPTRPAPIIPYRPVRALRD